MKEVDYDNKRVVKINEFCEDITIYKLKECDEETKKIKSENKKHILNSK